MLQDASAIDTEIKNEVVTAYNEVLRKLKVTKRVTQQEENIAEENRQLVELVVKETPDVLAKNLADFKSSINEVLKNLETKLMAEQSKLANIQRVIELKSRELTEISDIKINIDSLTALIMAQKEKTLEFERDMKERKQNFEYEMLQKRRDGEMAKRDFDQELEHKRAVLDEEFKEREARVMAREQEYRDLKDREAAIIAREQEYRELKEKAERFPHEMQRAIQKTELTVTEHLTLKFDLESRLARKEEEADRKVYQQTIAMLEAKIARISHELQNISSI